MNAKRMMRPWLGALVLTLVIAGCEGREGVLLEPVRVSQDSRSAAPAAAAKVRGVVPAHVTTHTVAQRIGTEGGTLELAGHRLIVPAGALDEAALFRMQLRRDGHVELELTALGVGNRGGVNLGARGFLKPVVLQISYDYAEGIDSPTRLQVAWVDDDGVLEILPSRVDTEQRTVTAELGHFSRYALITS